MTSWFRFENVTFTSYDGENKQTGIQVNILIFGASGSTGHELVKQALKQGHHVKAFVRDPKKLSVRNSNLMLIKGDVADRPIVDRAVKRQDAVLCALGASTPIEHNQTLIDGVTHIVDAMERTTVKRLIYLSFLGVKESRKQSGFFLNYVIAPVLHNLIADHETKEEIIRQSELEWTIVRPPKLTNGRYTGVFRSGESIWPRSVFPTISRADVADFMLRQLKDPAFIRRAPMVMH